MKFSTRRGYINRESYVAQYLALAIFTVGVVRTLGSDDLLAAFAAGEFRYLTLYGQSSHYFCQVLPSPGIKILTNGSKAKHLLP
jgi:hypothetical protein